MQSKGWGLRVSRARESSRRSLLCIFPLESKARSYTAPHFCMYLYTYIQHDEHAFIFYSDDGKKEAENLSSRIQLSAMHTHTTLPSTHPTYPTGLSYLYTASTLAREREGELLREPSGERETHTRAKSMLPSFAQTHTTQGSWFLAKMAWQGQLTLAMPFSLLNSLGGDLKNTTKCLMRPNCCRIFFLQ
jgi:hypothetical protein